MRDTCWLIVSCEQRTFAGCHASDHFVSQSYTIGAPGRGRRRQPTWLVFAQCVCRPSWALFSEASSLMRCSNGRMSSCHACMSCASFFFHFWRNFVCGCALQPRSVVVMGCICGVCFSVPTWQGVPGGAPGAASGQCCVCWQTPDILSHAGPRARSSAHTTTCTKQLLYPRLGAISCCLIDVLRSSSSSV